MNHEGHKGHEGLGVDLEGLARRVIDAGLKVHRALGPCLLESAYEHCLAHELHSRDISVVRQVALPIVYDLVVENAIIIEIKAVDILTRLAEAQILTYLKLSGYRLGFLMNFNVELSKHGLKRVVR